MKFYRLREIRSVGDELVCKATTTGSFFWPILHSAIALAFLLRGIQGGPIYGLEISTGTLCYTGAAIFALLAWAALGQYRARSKPTNWLMRCNRTGVLIKYRSFENWRFTAEDPQVVGFDYSEIAEIRTAREKRRRPDTFKSGSYIDEYFTFLELCLADADTSALEAHLEAERKAPAPLTVQTRWFTSTAMRWEDYPVEVLPGGIVRVRWKSTDSYRITPPLPKALAYLGRYVKTTDSVSEKVDLRPARTQSPEEADRRILELARSGDKLAAVKSTRDIYGCSLTEALAYVDALQSQPQAITPTSEETPPEAYPSSPSPPPS